MRKNQFCEVYAVNAGQNQVLITLDYELGEDAPHKLTQRTDVKGLVIQMAFCFKKKTEVVKAFNKYDKEAAEKFYKNAVELVEKNS